MTGPSGEKLGFNPEDANKMLSEESWMAEGDAGKAAEMEAKRGNLKVREKLATSRAEAFSQEVEIPKEPKEEKIRPAA